MDIERYKRDMLTTLQGMAHYAMVNNYQISKIMSKLNTLIHRHEKGLPNKECNYLSHFIAILATSTVSLKSIRIKQLRMHVKNQPQVT